MRNLLDPESHAPAPVQQSHVFFHAVVPPLTALVSLQSGVEKLAQLRVLFLSNNKVRDWTEIDRLAALERLDELLLVGNPLYNDHKDNNTLPEYRVEVSGSGHSASRAVAFVGILAPSGLELLAHAMMLLPGKEPPPTSG